MSNVYLITEGQVTAASKVLRAVAAFIEAYTPDDVADPDYAYSRSRALEMLNDLPEDWQHLPTTTTIKHRWPARVIDKLRRDS